MKWFKHMVDAHKDPGLRAVFKKYGLEGEARFWRLVSIIAEKYEIDTESVVLDLETIRESLRFRSATDCRPFLDLLTTQTQMVVEYSDTIVTIKWCKLSEIRDNYTKNLQVTGKNVSKKFPLDKIKNKNKNIIPPNPQKGDDGILETQCNDIAKIWNDYAVDYKLTKVKTPISKDRMDRMKSALKEFTEIDDWSKIICAVGLIDFNLGKNDRGWKADFDWLFHKTKFNYRKMWELYESTNGENDGDKQAGVKPSEDGDAFPF